MTLSFLSSHYIQSARFGPLSPSYEADVVKPPDAFFSDFLAGFIAFACSSWERGTSEQLANAKDSYLPVSSEAGSSKKRNKWRKGAHAVGRTPVYAGFDLDPASLRWQQRFCAKIYAAFERANLLRYFFLERFPPET
jgi:hypothetical protein